MPNSSYKVFLLVDHLDHCIAGSSTVLQQQLLERDLMITLLMWETPLRGNDIGKVSFKDFFLANGQPLMSPDLISDLDGLMQNLPTAPPVHFQLILRPNGTKTTKCQQCGPHLIVAKEDGQHSFLVRLPLYIQHMYPAGSIQSSHLFSPLTAEQRHSFADAP